MFVGKIPIVLVLIGVLLFLAGCTGSGSAQEPESGTQTAPPPETQNQSPAPTYACPDGTVAASLSDCPKMKCSDGTEYGACSLNKPKFCGDGNFIDKASACGCDAGYDVQHDSCIVHQVQTQPAPAPIPTNISCTSQFADAEHMDVFDSHAHIMSKISASQIISEMDKANVGMLLLYPIDGDDDSSSLQAMSNYPGRFVAFVDTPDSPQPSTWLTQGQAFTTFAEAQLGTGKFCGIGETNLRYYSTATVIPPPTVYVSPDTPLWLSLVDLSAQYHVPISFHFVPDDTAANAAFERMLNHNKNATVIWAHLGFNNMPLNRTALNDFLLRYPNMYFDTAGIQNMQNPLPQPNSNWARLTGQSYNGRLNEEWAPFFETWNTRILFGSDAGGGSNGLERWLNYADNTVDGATPNAVGHWRTLLSSLDYNSARNILNGNARVLFLKEQMPPYKYLVSSDGKCYSVLVSSNSSVSGFIFDQDTSAIAFTVAGSIGTAGSAAITIPTILVRGNVTASVDGQSVQIKEMSNSTYTTISLEYAGGIRSIALTPTP